MSMLFENTTCDRIVDFYACTTLAEQLDFALDWKRCKTIAEDDALVNSTWVTTPAAEVNKGYTARMSWVVIDPTGSAVGDVITLENTINTVNGVTAIARIHVTVE